MPAPPVAVVEVLHGSVALHLLAIEQYEGQSEHFRRWGYPKLADKYAKDVEEERGHLSEVLKRLEFYDVAANFAHDKPDWPRHDFVGVIDSNLMLETTAVEYERAAVLKARAAGDELTAAVFADLLEGSEGSVAENESIQRVIEQIGLDNYLASQV